MEKSLKKSLSTKEFINRYMKTFKQVEAIDCLCEETYKDLEITEAEYQGKKAVSYTHLTLPTKRIV